MSTDTPKDDTPTAAPRFYILSLKWSRDRECLTWWQPARSGYSMMLDKAGIYSEEEAMRIADGRETLAIPVEAADALACRAVHGNHRKAMVDAQVSRKGTP